MVRLVQDEKKTRGGGEENGFNPTMVRLVPENEKITASSAAVLFQSHNGSIGTFRSFGG